MRQHRQAVDKMVEHPILCIRAQIAEGCLADLAGILARIKMMEDGPALQSVWRGGVQVG